MTTQNLNKLPGTIAVPMDKIRITIYCPSFSGEKWLFKFWTVYQVILLNLKIDFVLQYTPNIQKVNADCTMFAFFVIIV